MFQWFHRYFRKTLDLEERIKQIENEAELLKKIQLCYDSLTQEDFNFFYEKYFVFTVQLPNIEDTIELISYYSRLIQKKQYISEVKLTEYRQYTSETFFIRENQTYINKIQSLETLKQVVLGLVNQLQTYVDNENVDIPTCDYYCRRLKPVFESIIELIMVYLNTRVSMQH